MNGLPAITVRPPWSWAICHGKNVENRVWQRSYRGPLAIHAGKGWDEDGEDSLLVQRAWLDAGRELRTLMPKRAGIPMGAVVAVADLVGICSDVAASWATFRCGCGPWAAAGQFHWKLADVRPLAEPVPCRGALGLWTLPDEVEAAVVAQLGERTDA